nr:hypothetical protein [Gnomoniopsis castaneae chrysovirus 1]
MDKSISELVRIWEGMSQDTTNLQFPSGWAKTDEGQKIRAIVAKARMISVNKLSTLDMNKCRRMYHYLKERGATHDEEKEKSVTQTVGYMVLPPGHGKSYMMSKELGSYGLVEADGVIDCRGTQELSDLKDAAQVSGNWSQYDNLWSSEINSKIKGKRCVVMVPSSTVGEAGGWHKVGTYLLTLDAWAANLMTRKGDMYKYRKQYSQAQLDGGRVFKDMDGLIAQVTKDAVQFMLS